VSDSYDPEFGTGANAAEVRAAIEGIIRSINGRAGLRSRKYIVAVVQGKQGKFTSLGFYSQDWRVIRFALHRALESL
jgi:hypothetical protein